MDELYLERKLQTAALWVLWHDVPLSTMSDKPHLTCRRDLTHVAPKSLRLRADHLILKRLDTARAHEEALALQSSCHRFELDNVVRFRPTYQIARAWISSLPTGIVSLDLLL